MEMVKIDPGIVYEAYAAVFEYPTSELARKARECASLTTSANIDAEAASTMDSFASYCEKQSVAHLQELYTRTFDLQPSCFPYVGYQLFGESYVRGNFLARLKDRYAQCGLHSGNELPDHLGLILRFLARIGDEEESRELIELCLAPALAKMIQSLADENPYMPALQSLLQSTKSSLSKGLTAEA
jgi:nitrate reductase delta subunit